MSLFEVGDFVRIRDVEVEDNEVNPNGFAGIIISSTLLLDSAGDVNNGEVVYSINLPVAWAENKYEWTFKQEELILLEPAHEVQ